jgi:hypothetical protein
MDCACTIAARYRRCLLNVLRQSVAEIGVLEKYLFCLFASRERGRRCYCVVGTDYLSLSQVLHITYVRKTIRSISTYRILLQVTLATGMNEVNSLAKDSISYPG